VANGAYYGGRMRIAPPAALDDGLLTLCKIKAMPRLKMMALFPLVKPGWHGWIKEVSFVGCRRVELEYEGKKWINLDGNLHELESPLAFEILQGALRFIV
jgi:diacylglycerol kinase family enzyme